MNKIQIPTFNTYLMSKFTVKQYSCLILLIFSIIFFLLSGCDMLDSRKSNFTWNDEVAELTGKDLKAWLRRAPFENELKPENSSDVMFSNAEQVFPFIGKYYNSVEQQILNRNSDAADGIFHTETVLFQDPKWGDLFVNATLMYNNDELYLNSSNASTGDIMFGGIDELQNTYHSSFGETSIHSKANNTKNAVYWASANSKGYLLGFYQMENLAFEVTIPLLGNDTLATLEKLKEVNQVLGLNIPEWANSQVSQLTDNPQAETLWKDPFEGIFEINYIIPSVFIKVKDTDFKIEPGPDLDAYYYKAKNGTDSAKFTIKLISNNLEAKDFDAKYKDMPNYEYFYRKTYYDEEEHRNEIQGKSHTFYNMKKSLELDYSYPKNNPVLKKQMHSVLKYLKVNPME